MVLGNTTYAATIGPADAIWFSVAAVRGPLEVFGYQSLASSPGMSVFDLGKQVRGSRCSPQRGYLLASCPAGAVWRLLRVSPTHKATRAWGRRVVVKARQCIPGPGYARPLRTLNSWSIFFTKFKLEVPKFTHRSGPGVSIVLGGQCWAQPGVHHTSAFGPQPVAIPRRCTQAALPCMQMAQSR